MRFIVVGSFLIYLSIFVDNAQSTGDVSLLECDFNTRGTCQYEDERLNGLSWTYFENGCTDEDRFCYLPNPPIKGGFIGVAKKPNERYGRNFVGLVSPEFSVTDQNCLHFAWYNYVCNALYPGSVSTLRFYARYESGNDVLLREIYCARNNWNSDSIQLPLGNYRLVLRALIENNWKDRYIALDDLTVTKGACQRPVTMTTPGDCDFDDLEACGYSYTEDSEFHIRTTTRQEVQLVSDTDPLPKGRFLFTGKHMSQMYLDDNKYKSKLQSPELTITQDSCLSAKYFNKVEPIDREVLQLLTKGTDGVETPLANLTKKPGDAEDNFHDVFLPLPRGTYRLVIQMNADKGFGLRDWVALDSVEIFHEPCQQVEALPDACETATDLCKNDGVCNSLGKKFYHCTCTKGYGPLCENTYACHRPADICVNNGTCTAENRTLSTCTCIPGTSGDNCEILQDCGIPSATLFSNATLVNYTGTSFGSRAFYKCKKDNLLIEREPEAKCSSYGGWLKYGGCRYVQCPEPTTDDPNLVLEGVTSRTVGGVATFRCKEGFAAVSGSKNQMVCNDPGHYLLGSVGYWSGDLTTCSKVPNCGEPPATFPNAVLTSFTSTSLGGQAYYKCTEGYYPTWNFPTTCRHYGTEEYVWAPLPTCESICPVKRGQTGSQAAVDIEIIDCSASGNDRFPATESCSDETKHTVVKDDEQPGDTIVYFGHDLCISLQIQRTMNIDHIYRDTNPSEESCYSFCLNPDHPAQRVVFEERHSYFWPPTGQIQYYQVTRRVRHYKLLLD